MKIVILVGLPGSGKTYLGAKMVQEDEVNRIYLDDISIIGLDKLKDAIDLYSWEYIIFSDVFMCRERDRIGAEKWLKENAAKYELEWIFFENAPDKCFANVKRRNASGDHRKVEELIKDLTKRYKIPEGVTVREVYG